MKLRGLLVWAGVLAALAAGLWFSNRSEKAKEGQPAADAPPKITALHVDQLTRIDIAKGGETTTIERGADNKWKLIAPKEMRTDADAANLLANSFNPLNSERLIEEKAGDLGNFGLTNPQLALALKTKDGKTTKLLIGDETPTSGGFFAKVDGDPRVFTLASANKTSIDKTWKDLQDKRLVAFDSDKLSRIELTVKGSTAEFGKNNQNEWQLVKPKPMRADGGHVEELVRKVKDAKMDPAVSADDSAKAQKEFAGAAVVAVAKVTDAAGTQQIEVRKSKDNAYYAKGSSLEGAYKVGSDLGDGISKAIDDYRQKKIFDFGWNDPNRVEIRDEGKVRTFAKDPKEKDAKWKEGNKELDATSVQALIDKLRDLAAAKFVDTGYTTPILEATVTSKEGQRTEKVLVSKTGDKYFAIRENEPSVYEVDAKTVEELKKAAADVKEPAPPKKDDAKKDEGKKK